MRDAALPAALLTASLGFALARQAPRNRIAALIVLVATAVPVSAIILPEVAAAPSTIGCAFLTLLFVAWTYLDRPGPPPVAIGAAAAAGLVVGALTSFGGQPVTLAIALPGALTSIPAAWLAGSHRTIVIRIAASWILAVSILSLGLTLTQGANTGTDHLD